MKNTHRFKTEISVRCPFKECGRIYKKKIIVEYETNQRGDVISNKVR